MLNRDIINIAWAFDNQVGIGFDFSMSYDVPIHIGIGIGNFHLHVQFFGIAEDCEEILN